MAITHVTSGETNINEGSSPGVTRTVSITLGTRTDGLLVAKVLVRAALGVTSVTGTWNGSAMSVDLSYNPSGVYRVVILSIPVGSGDGSARDLVITFTNLTLASPLQAAIVHEVYDGCAQSSYVGVTNSANDTGTTASLSITPADNNSLIVAAMVSEWNTPGTVGTGETLTQDHDFGAFSTAASYAIQTTAGAQTIDWTGGSAEFWALGAVVYKVATATSTAWPVAFHRTPRHFQRSF